MGRKRAFVKRNKSVFMEMQSDFIWRNPCMIINEHIFLFSIHHSSELVILSNTFL